MRILVRTSKWAVWARRLGSFALPLTIIPVLMHRAGAIPTSTFEIIEIVAIAVALLALATAIGAFVRIWVTGDHGWGRAVIGLICSLACLAPLGMLAFDYLHYPMADEVTTDPADPPPLLSAQAVAAPTPAAAARLAVAFPNIKPRNYPLAPGQMFDIVDKLVADRGWDVLQRQEPTINDGSGQINALAMTLLGFRDEVSIRLAGSADGTSVSMRSAALTPLHEPGDNATRVEGFLDALDDRITQLQKDQPAGTTADSEDDSADQTPTPAPIPLPVARARKR
jgi:hypothetical protein